MHNVLKKSFLKSLSISHEILSKLGIRGSMASGGTDDNLVPKRQFLGVFVRKKMDKD